MEWVAIYDKNRVRFPNPSALKFLYFYNSELDHGWNSNEAEHRKLPVKISCNHCRSPIADEGRNMWLAYCTLFDFPDYLGIPDSFRHKHHLFYGSRCLNMHEIDKEKKWMGHKDQSNEWKDPA
jgi:hypothetical protein